MNDSDQQTSVSKNPRYSSIGIFSISAGVLSVLIILLTIAFGRLGWVPQKAFPDIFYVPILIAPILALVGTGLGIFTIIQKNSKKILGIFGCALNGIVLASFLLLFVFIFMQSRNGISDGCIFGKAKAWIDQNENAVWDTNETALSGVLFAVSINQRDDHQSDKSTSNGNGEATLMIWPTTCNNLKWLSIKIQATPPDGYQATTPNQIILSGNELSTLGRIYTFGFIKRTSP